MMCKACTPCTAEGEPASQEGLTTLQAHQSEGIITHKWGVGKIYASKQPVSSDLRKPCHRRTLVAYVQSGCQRFKRLLCVEALPNEILQRLCNCR